MYTLNLIELCAKIIKPAVHVATYLYSTFVLFLLISTNDDTALIQNSTTWPRLQSVIPLKLHEPVRFRPVYTTQVTSIFRVFDGYNYSSRIFFHR